MSEALKGVFTIVPPMINGHRGTPHSYAVPVSEDSRTMDVALPDGQIFHGGWNLESYELRNGATFRQATLEFMGRIQPPPIIAVRFNQQSAGIMSTSGMACDLVFENVVYGLALVPQSNLQLIILPDFRTLRAVAWQKLPTRPPQVVERRSPMSPRVGRLVHAEVLAPDHDPKSWRMQV